MPKPTKITEFIDKLKADPEMAVVQGHVPTELRTKVIEQMKADKAAGIKITWDLLLEASLRSYLSERGNHV